MRDQSVKLKFPAINIQHPISEEILSGRKVVETRGYPIPSHYIGLDMLIIETPGRSGDFDARIVGMVTFANSFEYISEDHFYSDSQRHKVDCNSPWKWRNGVRKFGWPIVNCTRLAQYLPAPAVKGIKFTRSIEIESQYVPYAAELASSPVSSPSLTALSSIS